MKKYLCILISVMLIISSSIALADKDGNGKSGDSKDKTQQTSNEGKNNGSENNKDTNTSNSDNSSQGQTNNDKNKDKKQDENKKVESGTGDSTQANNDIDSLNKQLKEKFKDKEKRKEIIKKIKELKKESKLIFLNGEEVVSDTPPVIKYGRMLLPVRAITNALGATVSWNGETHTATITKGDTVVVIEMGNKTVMVNGNPVELDVPAEVINNRTMVPLRFLAQVFKKNVEYDDGTVIIGDDDAQTPQPSQTPTPTPQPSTTPEVTPEATPEATPTPTPLPEATSTPTPMPTETPEPTSTP